MKTIDAVSLAQVMKAVKIWKIHQKIRGNPRESVEAKVKTTSNGWSGTSSGSVEWP
jgi:hypothetical protein